MVLVCGGAGSCGYGGVKWWSHNVKESRGRFCFMIDASRGLELARLVPVCVA